jgi:hypothetical protein
MRRLDSSRSWCRQRQYNNRNQETTHVSLTSSIGITNLAGVDVDVDMVLEDVDKHSGGMILLWLCWSTNQVLRWIAENMVVVVVVWLVVESEGEGPRNFVASLNKSSYVAVHLTFQGNVLLPLSTQKAPHSPS